MIKEVLELLETDNFYGKSELIEKAKGKNKIPLSIREAWEQRKRSKQWQ